MERKVEINNKELRELLQDRNRIVLDGRKQSKQMEKLQEDLNKNALKAKKIDGKAGKIIDKLGIELERNKTKFEMITGASLTDEQIELTITDRVQQFVEELERKDKDSKKKKDEKK